MNPFSRRGTKTAEDAEDAEGNLRTTLNLQIRYFLRIPCALCGFHFLLQCDHINFDQHIFRQTRDLNG